MEAQTTGLMLVCTSNFLETMKKNPVTAEVAERVIRDALNRATNTVNGIAGADMFIYKNGKPSENRKEDGGRTEIVHINGLPEKVYAKLEDYGEPSTWMDIYEPDTAEMLKEVMGNKRHKLTVMFASDY